MRFHQAGFSDRAERVFSFGLGVMTGSVEYYEIFIVVNIILCCYVVTSGNRNSTTPHKRFG